MMHIIVSHVSKTIKNNPVIRDISMELHSGVVYGFKGINVLRYKLKAISTT